jgi:uncharacterized protein YoxC
MGRVKTTVILFHAIVFLAVSILFGDVDALPSEERIDPSYIYVSSDQVAYIQWTESNGHLIGQYQALYVDKDNPLKLMSAHALFTGVRNGSAITLTFPSFSQPVVTGIFKSGALILVAPDASGLLVKYIFRPGSVDDYNRAALALQKRVEWQATLAARRRAVETAYAELQGAYNTLEQDTVRLALNTDFTNVLKSYADHMTQMQKNYMKLEADADKRPLTCVQLSTVQVDVSTLEVNMSSIEVDNSSFDTVRGPILAGIDRVTRDIQILLETQQNLRAAIAADLSKSVPSPSRFLDGVSHSVNDAISRARKQIRLSSAEIRAAEARSREYNNKAKELLQAAREFVKTLTCVPQ